ncbi:deoxyxylulose-5-phosphate synthase [Kitasatospora purpeofusca]|uniref:deoxyxylulose-5-phosphate synthase n=1 Tax=Kitasatospora purpeofusca TaxID=67352 RepID=UPI0035E23817
MAHTKSSFVCLPCRASYKRAHDAFAGERRCPRCAGGLIAVGSAFAVPRRRDVAGWRTLTLLLNAGIRFHRTSCCGGAGYRPRTRHEVRERTLYARRSGEPLARALLHRDVPWERTAR